jgi:hypothetical protein
MSETVLDVIQAGLKEIAKRCDYAEFGNVHLGYRKDGKVRVKLSILIQPKNDQKTPSMDQGVFAQNSAEYASQKPTT